MDGEMKREEMEQHLLFHKALTEDSETYARINGYMDILGKAGLGEKLNDPADESVRAAFSLVLDNGIDPWEIDLSEFAKLYSRKVAENKFDMIVAGKLMLMAWKILRLQSEATCSRSDEPPEEEFFDFSFEDEDEAMVVPEISFKEAYGRETSRPVTMYELLDAFEEARAEMEICRERERVRIELNEKLPKKFDNKAHDEDDKQDVEFVWGRIVRLGTGPIQIDELYTGDIMENLRVFVSVLHLVRDGRLGIWQGSLPEGEIFVEMNVPGIPSVLEGREEEAEAVS
ncbi:MAG: chromosome segregation protein ScpA [Candidatus Methanoplasma sp.]|jgi:segregation and condensation protein A|nr:chromosome segregation protein ScpA [Candidatus Methanoplasma sp.]